MSDKIKLFSCCASRIFLSNDSSYTYPARWQKSQLWDRFEKKLLIWPSKFSTVKRLHE